METKLRYKLHMHQRRLWLIFAFAVHAIAAPRTSEIPFVSHDGHPMLGKLTLPETEGRHPIVIYMQTAEGMTVDMKRPLGGPLTISISTASGCP